MASSSNTTPANAATSNRGETGFKLFSDCVHGHYELPPLCVKIIDTPIFQRLRFVKQLGFGYYVYPGAAHNRFEHSLGVCYLAGEIVDALNKNIKKDDPKEIRITEKEKLSLQVAGLCHDLGHGPFSHTWERFVKKYDAEWKHEVMSGILFEKILEEEEICKEFDKEELDRQVIKDMISGENTNDPDGKRAFLYEIISNGSTGIDVDKWDYLLRDGKQLNIKVTFDPHRLLKCQRIMETRDGKFHICYRDKEQGNIWHMYLMRAELHRVAYQHPVVKIIETMWLDALEAARNEGFKFRGNDLAEVQKYPEDYILLTDEIFQDILNQEDLNSFTKESHKILERIQNRKLYSRIKKNITNKDKSIIENQRKTIQEDPKIDLYPIKISVEIPDLSKSVYLYDEYNSTNAETKSDWQSRGMGPQIFDHYVFYSREEFRRPRLEKEDTPAP